MEGMLKHVKGGNTWNLQNFNVYRNFASLPLNTLMEYPINIAKEGFTLTQPTKDYFIHSN